MTDKTEQNLEKEIRRGRKFTAQEAVGRMAGPGAMKGASPVSREKQAQLEAEAWIKAHVVDATGALQLVLQREIAASKVLQEKPELPLVAIKACFERLLRSDELLKDIVREADFEWGRRMDERPHFDRDGAPADAEDPYTIKDVRKSVEAALASLRGA